MWSSVSWMVCEQTLVECRHLARRVVSSLSLGPMSQTRVVDASGTPVPNSPMQLTSSNFGSSNVLVPTSMVWAPAHGVQRMRSTMLFSIELSWSSDASILRFLNNRDQSVSCPNSPRGLHIPKGHTWQDFRTELMRSRWVCRYSTIAPNGITGLSNSSSIPWNLPTNFHPDIIATILQTYLLPLCVLLSQQSHSFPSCAMLTYDDSRLILHKPCQFQSTVSCK